MKREKFLFENDEGQKLAALLEMPDNVRAFALFAHCFTCGKDLKAASRIARILTQHGIAVLRFDFTGLGGSDGDFSNTNFSSNVADLRSAAAHLRDNFQAPSLLIGHSLGGSAILSVAGDIPEARAVVTIGSPGEISHVKRLFEDDLYAIEKLGAYPVRLAGRTFVIRQQLVDDIQQQKVAEKVFRMNKPLLVFHAPEDDTVLIEQAEHIFRSARHPKSFISLHGADHLLSDNKDADYVGECIVAWSSRYLDMTP
jgi:putative redox protein